MGTASPSTNIPHQSGTLVTNEGPPWTHHRHPETTVYIKVRSWPQSSLLSTVKFVLQVKFIVNTLQCLILDEGAEKYVMLLFRKE